VTRAARARPAKQGGSAARTAALGRGRPASAPAVQTTYLIADSPAQGGAGHRQKKTGGESRTTRARLCTERGGGEALGLHSPEMSRRRRSGSPLGR